MSSEDFWKAIDAWRATYEFRVKGRQWRITTLLGLFAVFGIVQSVDFEFVSPLTRPGLTAVLPFIGFILSLVWFFRDRNEQALERHWIGLAASLKPDWAPTVRRVPAFLGPGLAMAICVALLAWALAPLAYVLLHPEIVADPLQPKYKM